LLVKGVVLGLRLKRQQTPTEHWIKTIVAAVTPRVINNTLKRSKSKVKNSNFKFCLRFGEIMTFYLFL